MRLTSLLFVVFSCILLVSGQCPGDDPSLQTWSSVFGGNTGAISITSAQKIKLDTSVTISTLTISGTLVFDDSKDLTLVSGQIRINTGGFLIIGSESCPYSMKANITLVGTDKNSVSLGTDPSDNGALGTKGIAVTTGGNLQLHGKLSLPSWTRLSATVAAGSSEITVEADVQWQVGDKIVIATTDYSPVYNTDTGEEYVPSQSEYHTIKSINGRTITLVNPVTFMHWGADYEKAEVGLLSRHIVLNGGAESVALQFGGHVIVRAAASAQISGVEFTSMGQLGVLGRYPLHFHLMRDQVGKGIYAKDNSFHHNFQRCVAIHDSNGILVQNNVAYNTIGHCYFLEDGGERKNTFDNNLGVLAKPGSLILSDNKPSIFWITNPDNTFTNNVAVEGTFGYWYSLPAQPVEASAATYANSDTVWPRYTPLLKFKDNVCHSQERNGLMVDEMVEPDQTTPLGSYLPSEGPYNQTFMYQSYRYIPVTAVFENTLAYKCRDHGIWTRGRSIHILNSVAVDNTNGILCVPGASLVENALIIGESENIGTPLKNWLPDFPRSRPVWWTNAMPILGIGNYDAGSPQFYRNITLKNFVSNSFRPAGGIFILPNGINMLYPSNKLEQFNFVNANEVYLENWPNDHCPAENDYCLLRDGPLGVNVNDLDGSVTGYVGGWIVGDTPMMLNPGCVHKPQWNGYACPPFQDAYVQLYVENTDTSSTNFGSSLTEHFRAAYYNLGWKTGDPYIHVTGGDVDETVRDRYAANLQTHRGYTLRFNHETPESLQLTIQGSAKNEWLVVALPYPSGTTFTITTSYENAPVTSVGSRDLVDKYHYHFDGSHLYVMIQNKYDSVSEFEGFSNHDGYSSYTKIKATCPGGNCGNGAWGDSPQPAIPAALNDPTSKFKALFLDSTCKTNSAFFSFNPNTYELSYTIYHALGKSAQKATLEGPSGTLILLDNAKSPIRGAVTLSRDKYVSLWNGEVSIKIATDSTSISGKIGCLGDCVAPNQIPVGDFCNAAGAIDLYTDSRNAKWDSWSWDDTFVSTLLFNSTEAYCGSHSVRMYWAASAGFVLHTGWQQVVTVDSSKYKYLQFFAKTSAVGSISDLLITLRINDDTDLPQLRVTKKYISNYVIEENWTRVRIPLADLGLTGTQSLSMVQINQFESWRESNYNVMYLDQLQIIGDEKDTLSTPLTGYGAAFAPENSEGCVIQTDYDTSAGSSSTNNGSSSTTDADSEEGSSATSIFVNLAIIVASIALLL